MKRLAGGTPWGGAPASAVAVVVVVVVVGLRRVVMYSIAQLVDITRLGLERGLERLGSVFGRRKHVFAGFINPPNPEKIAGRRGRVR